MKRAAKLSRRQRFLIRGAKRAELERIRRLVENRLLPHQPAGVRFVVSPTQIERHEDRWYVVVGTDPEGATVGKYERALMKTEDDLLSLDGLCVMLTSMLPMDDELEYEMPVLWAVSDAARR